MLKRDKKENLQKMEEKNGELQIMEEIGELIGFQIMKSIKNGKITDNGRDGRDKNGADTR